MTADLTPDEFAERLERNANYIDMLDDPDQQDDYEPIPDLTPAQQAKVRVFGLDRPEDYLSWEWAAKELHAEWCDCGGYTPQEARTARGEL